MEQHIILKREIMQKWAFCLLFLVPAYTFLISATEGRATPMIKTTTNLVTKMYSEYFYNANRQVIKVQNSKGNVTTYEYEADKVIMNYQLSASTNSDTFLLNDEGFISEAHQTHSISKYKLTNNGYNYEIKSYYKEKIEWQTGNLIANGNIVMATTRTYLTDKAPKNDTIWYQYYPNTKNTIGHENMGLIFKGRSSTNLVKKTIWDSGKSLSVNNYHFDNKGRVSISVCYSGSGKLIDSTAYTYY